MAHQGQGQKIKEKIKHLFHHDHKAATTPDGSPGYADEGSPQTTKNVPEGFYPGAAPVVPEETHSTAPYSSALGQHQVPQEQPTSVPADSAAMMGAPPSGMERTAAPGSDDRGMNPSGEASGSESDVQPEKTDSGVKTDSYPVKTDSYPDKKSKVQTEDSPTTDSVENAWSA